MEATEESAKLGKRELNRIHNRQAILTAARACFSESGYDRVTIRDIIRRTDLAAGTFYNYFSDKQDIFSALLTDFLASINERLRELRKKAANEEDFVRNTYLALFEATAHDPVIYELAHRNDQAIRDLFGADILGLAMSTLEEDVKAASKRGLFASIDEEYLAAAFFGVAYEMSMRVSRRARDEACDPDKEARKAADFATNLFMGGVDRIYRQSQEQTG
ncbi:TetR/AcrR family transcriptional regulator [Marinobacteraceae bacterium S3BR75-40.1]